MSMLKKTGSVRRLPNKIYYHRVGLVVLNSCLSKQLPYYFKGDKNGAALEGAGVHACTRDHSSNVRY
jgi:hypothetical protein